MIRHGSHRPVVCIASDEAKMERLVQAAPTRQVADKNIRKSAIPLSHRYAVCQHLTFGVVDPSVFHNSKYSSDRVANAKNATNPEKTTKVSPAENQPSIHKRMDGPRVTSNCLAKVGIASSPAPCMSVRDWISVFPIPTAKSSSSDTLFRYGESLIFRSRSGVLVHIVHEQASLRRREVDVPGGAIPAGDADRETGQRRR